MRWQIIATALMAMGVTAAGATTPDSTIIGVVESHEAPLSALFAYSYKANPAAMQYRHLQSLTNIGVTGYYAHSEEAEIVQQGRGHALANVGVDTYLRMPTEAVMWGNASFTTGMIRDVKWCSTADFERLHPYIIGDSVGGNRSMRQYAFGGGYSGCCNRWTWGAEVNYLAAIYYRDRDPRIKDVVSDLALKIGATYLVGGGYTLGASAGLTVYNQDCDVDFYNPMNDIFEYVMTGLGSTYVRFNGTENPAYDGIGYNVALQCISTANTGLKATAGYDYERIRQILRDNNHLTLTAMALHRLSGEVGYMTTAGRVTVGTVADVSWLRKIGTEHLYGSGESNIYPEIGTRDQYYTDEVKAEIVVPIEMRPSRGHRVTMLPKMGYLYCHEHYMRPSRDLEMCRYIPGVSVDYGYRISDQMLVGITLGGEYGVSKAETRRLTGLDPHCAIGKMINHNFDMLTTDVAELHCVVTADREMSEGLALSVAVKYDYRNHRGHGNTHCAMASVGLKF